MSSCVGSILHCLDKWKNTKYISSATSDHGKGLFINNVTCQFPTLFMYTFGQEFHVHLKKNYSFHTNFVVAIICLHLPEVLGADTLLDCSPSAEILV